MVGGHHEGWAGSSTNKNKKLCQTGMQTFALALTILYRTTSESQKRKHSIKAPFPQEKCSCKDKQTCCKAMGVNVTGLSLNSVGVFSFKSEVMVTECKIVIQLIENHLIAARL